MNRALRITKAELVYMTRSQIALVGIITLFLLSAVAAFTSHDLREQENRSRASHQIQTDALFKAQPARHPHRMVHYGSYVYRPISTLAGFDPGIDPYSGTSLYLEGHRQNSSTISAARENSGLMRFGQLTPAFVLQTLAPLLMIFLGFGVMARERENGSLKLLLSTGVPPQTLLMGKILALVVVALLALLPALIALGFMAISDPGESIMSLVIGLGYSLYLIIWAMGITAISALVKSSKTSLLLLLGFWTIVAIVMPRGAAALAYSLEPLPSRVVSDLKIQAELRQIGDSHNPNDPHFADFKAKLLAQYGISKVEDLPFNYRGALSIEGEALTSNLFDKHLEKLAASQKNQSAILGAIAVFSPSLAVRRLSMRAAGTDLETQLRFLKQGEAHRFLMVQTLNSFHRDQLSHSDDSARSKDPEAEKRTRIESHNWAKVPDFQFQTADLNERLHSLGQSLLSLIIWLIGMIAISYLAAKSLIRSAF